MSTRRFVRAEDIEDVDGTIGDERYPGDGTLGSFFRPEADANSQDWFTQLKNNPDRKKPNPHQSEQQDEIRWGDSREFQVTLPAAGGTPFATPIQIMQITRAARTWSAFFSLEFLNAPDVTQQAGESMIGAFAVTAQIGSSRTTFDIAPTLVFPVTPTVLNPVVTNTQFLNAFPAKQILVVGTIQVVGLAFATDRIVRARLSVGVAPYTR